jgi:hypothetical protein
VPVEVCQVFLLRSCLARLIHGFWGVRRYRLVFYGLCDSLVCKGQHNGPLSARILGQVWDVPRILV